MVNYHGLVPRTCATNFYGANLGNFHQKHFFLLKTIFFALKFRSFATISIFDQNSYFGQNFRFLTKSLIFLIKLLLPTTFATKNKDILAKNIFFVKIFCSHPNCDVFPQFRFLTKIPNLAKNLLSGTKNSKNSDLENY